MAVGAVVAGPPDISGPGGAGVGAPPWPHPLAPSEVNRVWRPHDLCSASSSRADGLGRCAEDGVSPELRVACPSADVPQLFPACSLAKRFEHFGFLMPEMFLELSSASSVGYILLFPPKTNE